MPEDKVAIISMTIHDALCNGMKRNASIYGRTVITVNIRGFNYGTNVVKLFSGRSNGLVFQKTILYKVQERNDRG